MKNWFRNTQSHVLTHFGYLFIEKSRKDAISEISKFQFFYNVLKIIKTQLFGKLLCYKNRNRTFSSYEYSLIYIPPYIYPHIGQKYLFFFLEVVGFELVIFHWLAWRLNHFAMLVDISESKICPKTPKMSERRIYNFLNIEIQDMTSRPNLIRTMWGFQ